MLDNVKDKWRGSGGTQPPAWMQLICKSSSPAFQARLLAAWYFKHLPVSCKQISSFSCNFSIFSNEFLCGLLVKTCMGRLVQTGRDGGENNWKAQRHRFNFGITTKVSGEPDKKESPAKRCRNGKGPTIIPGVIFTLRPKIWSLRGQFPCGEFTQI